MSIAVDLQGPDVVRTYTEKFKVTFPVAVDTADIFGEAFGLKAIPVTFLVDEVGIVRLRGGGPSEALLAQIETVLGEPLTEVRASVPQLPAALDRLSLEARITGHPEDWKSRLALAQLFLEEGKASEALVQCEAAWKLQSGEPSIAFTWGLVLLRQDQRIEALAKLKQARDLDPNNWRIRKQIWALENPDKFYTAESPDYDWQKEELAREKKSGP